LRSTQGNAVTRVCWSHGLGSSEDRHAILRKPEIEEHQNRDADAECGVKFV